MILQRLFFYTYSWWSKIIIFILFSIFSYIIYIYFFSIILFYHILLTEIFCFILLILLIYNTYSSILLSKYIILWGSSVFIILSFLMFFGWAYIPNWVIFYLYIKFYFKSIKIFMCDVLWVLVIYFKIRGLECSLWV